MAPKKSKKDGKSKSKQSSSKTALSKEIQESDAERMQLLKEANNLAALFKKEEQSFNEYQQQRERINYFWTVDRKKLEDLSGQLRNKERERQDMEEKFKVEIKTHQQRIKHLLYEHQNEISSMKKDQERSLQYVQNEYRDAEREIKSDKKRLQFDLKESEVAHESYLKTLKHQLDERVTALRQEFERYAKDIQQKYERKRKRVRELLEAQRKSDTQTIEERKNLHISQLMSAHERAFHEIKTYYNDITHNNLDLIKSLKEELADLKKKESQDEKLMFEISQENKRMSEPLKKALQDVETLGHCYAQYQKDKISLRDVKAQVLTLESEYATLDWEYEVLTQRHLQVEKEVAELQAAFQSSVHDVQQRSDFKRSILEKQMRAMQAKLEYKDAELHNVLANTQLDPMTVDRITRKLDNVMERKQKQVEDLEHEDARVLELQQNMAKVVEAKLKSMGMVVDDLGFALPSPDTEG